MVKYKSDKELDKLENEGTKEEKKCNDMEILKINNISNIKRVSK